MLTEIVLRPRGRVVATAAADYVIGADLDVIRLSIGECLSIVLSAQLADEIADALVGALTDIADPPVVTPAGRR